MVAKVQLTEQDLVIVPSPEMIDSLSLTEGAEVDIRPFETTPVTYISNDEVLRSVEKTLPRADAAYRTLAESERNDITAEEALATYRETLPDHEEAYRTLAK